MRYGSFGDPFGRDALRHRSAVAARVLPFVGHTDSSAEAFVHIEACVPPSRGDNLEQVLGREPNQDEILRVGDAGDLVSQ